MPGNLLGASGKGFPACQKRQRRISLSPRQEPLPLYGLLIFHGVGMPPFLYPLLCQWNFGCFHILAIVNNAAKNEGVYIPLGHPDFNSFG